MTALTAALVLAPTLVRAAQHPSARLSARDVVAMAMGSARTPYSGLVEVSGRLGLPALPFASAAVAQLNATSRVRAWWVSPSLWRTDSLSAFGQREDVAFAAGVLEWDYESTTVHVQPSVPGIRQPRTDDLLPPSAARLLLSWASPQDTVTALPVRTIAGRDASGARVSSGEPGSSVRSLDVWVDTSSGLPVELDVRARAVADPVLTTRFLDLSVQRPSDQDVSPALSDSAHWSVDRPDVLSFVRAAGDSSLPTSVLGLPQSQPGSAGLPVGIATYGTGFERAALLQVPDRLLPQIEESVPGVTTVVGSGRAVVLRTRVVQVALLELADGRGFLLAGTLTSTAMDAAVRDALTRLAGGTR